MDQTKIGKFIQDARKKKGLTQTELGDKLGVSYKAVSKWENGNSFLDVSLMKPLCEELNISLNELLNGEKDNKVDGVVDYIKYQKKKYKAKVIISIVVSFLLIICSLFALYFVNNYKQNKVYVLDGEGEYFWYRDAMFIDSSSKYIYVAGDIINKDDSKDISIKKVILKCGDRLIFGGGSHNGHTIESKGYNELFPLEVVKNMNDWYLEITFIYNNEIETDIIHLNNMIIDSNEYFFPQRIDPISESNDLTAYNDEIKNRTKVGKERKQYLESKEFKVLEKYNPITNEEIPQIYNENDEDSLVTYFLSTTWKKTYNNHSYITITDIFGPCLIEYYDSNYKIYTTLSNNVINMEPIDNMSCEEDDNECFHKKRYYYRYYIDKKSGECINPNCPSNSNNLINNFIKLYESEFKEMK